MRMDRYLTQHPLNRVYRLGAALFGVGLTIFGVLGLTNRLAYTSTQGQLVLGLSSNGLLATISVLVGVVLVAAAVVGGAVASTTMIVIGLLFLLSGLVNLFVLNSPALNLLAFQMQNVVFSVVSGMLLLFLGLYGRLSGGLTRDNPYVRARLHEPVDTDRSTELADARRRLAELEELSNAEFATIQGTATREQERMVLADALRRAQQRRREIYRRTAGVPEQRVPEQQPPAGARRAEPAQPDASAQPAGHEHEPAAGAPTGRGGRLHRRGGARSR
ncbi:DUF4383 domain-containing protein [Goodfellowiella coeruleoviolacea]|uniref:DUF4383 domain-containing protein n=1 Tax=Goodfellowiella coeruleoviolacea TaxID=334858 RepID=A0AAE3KGD4_9PSEU|nr:DUF4383 domain-containing protein [Goodfellowiella coeruleoviolacea]MCP2165364.1 protein of unknown function (DUF4383) [Goodfellowiella coeruleoviolacea]